VDLRLTAIKCREPPILPTAAGGSLSRFVLRRVGNQCFPSRLRNRVDMSARASSVAPAIQSIPCAVSSPRRRSLAVPSLQGQAIKRSAAKTISQSEAPHPRGGIEERFETRRWEAAADPDSVNLVSQVGD